MWLLMVLAAVVAGWATGGSLVNLAQYRIQGLWWLVLAAAMQLLASNAGLFQSANTLAPVLHCLSYAPLFWALWLNRRLRGILVIGAGSLLNFAAIVANGGLMPVDEQALLSLGEQQTAALLRTGESFTHILVGPGTSLSWLGDVIAFPDLLYVFRHTTVSVGDLVIAAGAIIMIWSLMNNSAAQSESASQT